MIRTNEKGFILETENTSYIIGIRSGLLLENLYYGRRISENNDFLACMEKFGNEYGNSILNYQNETNSFVTCDNLSMEYSFAGTGDYRELPLETIMPDFTSSQRFYYKDYQIYDGIFSETKNTKMPHAHGDESVQTLELVLEDKMFSLELKLVYTVFPKEDVITRRTVLINNGMQKIAIEKIMSMQLDLPETNYKLVTFDGLWTRERHKNTKELVSGAYINESTTGASSNRHNPFICLEKEGCTNDLGECFGFNLIYSGNHYESVEVSPYEKIRILMGIQPKQFSWELNQKEVFYTPEAVLCFSHEGSNDLSQKLSKFTRKHIINSRWEESERPILVNNWEATYFDFNKSKILAIAKEAKELGIEMFVLDDGWFGDRNDDKKGLGDWFVNEKKMGGSLQDLAEKINKMGLDFGLWMEPEMVNENSELYQTYPEWAVKIPERETYLGRNQLVLDYTNPQVCNYIVETICKILASANISYVKWDMNRHITDAYSPTLGNRQKEFHHRYILGVYDVMGRIVSEFPEILFESCASGGNRFDLGMLYYMPQTWTSDDTDVNERVAIQEGTSYGYPISSMGAHVSAAPNHQTLRKSSIETRFSIACFGLLGYELDLTKLTGQEKKIVKNQVEFYKKYRKTLQFGDFYREKIHNGNTIWASVAPDKNQAIALLYQSLAKPNSSSDILRVPGLNPLARYHIKVRKIAVSIKEFGSLVNMVSPVHITEDGLMQSLVNKVYMMEGEDEEYTVSGDLLMYAGIKLKQRFIGTGYNSETRLMGDFSSRLYVIEKANDENRE